MCAKWKRIDARKERKKAKREKEREGEFCVCVEVGSRKDIVTDMNIESTWQRPKQFITITLFVLLLTFFFF